MQLIVSLSLGSNDNDNRLRVTASPCDAFHVGFSANTQNFMTRVDEKPGEEAEAETA